MRQGLEELKEMQIAKNKIYSQFLDCFYKHLNKFYNMYFYYVETDLCCKFNVDPKDIREGKIVYTEYFVGQNYLTETPQVYDRKHEFKISELPLDKIEFLTKEDFKNRLKEQLQDALDRM